LQAYAKRCINELIFDMIHAVKMAIIAIIRHGFLE